MALVSVRLTDESVKELDRVAKETERSRSYHIQKALDIYLDEYVDLEIALERVRIKDEVLDAEEAWREVEIQDNLQKKGNKGFKKTKRKRA